MKVLFGNHKHAIGMIANFFMSEKTTLIKNTKGNMEQERKKRE